MKDGIWLHLPTGIHYEQPTANGQPTYRSLKTRDVKEGIKEFYRRRAKGDSAYQKSSATTIGEVIRAYKDGGYRDRQRHQRPDDTRKAEEVNCDKLLEFSDPGAWLQRRHL